MTSSDDPPAVPSKVRHDAAKAAINATFHTLSAKGLEEMAADKVRNDLNFWAGITYAWEAGYETGWDDGHSAGQGFG